MHVILVYKTIDASAIPRYISCMYAFTLCCLRKDAMLFVEYLKKLNSWLIYRCVCVSVWLFWKWLHAVHFMYLITTKLCPTNWEKIKQTPGKQLIQVLLYSVYISFCIYSRNENKRKPKMKEGFTEIRVSNCRFAGRCVCVCVCARLCARLCAHFIWFAYCQMYKINCNLWLRV